MFPELHRQRMHNTLIEFYKVDELPQLHEMIRVPNQYKRGIVKCRILYGRNNYTFQLDFYSQRKINSLKLVHCNEIDYKYKYSDRNSLENCLNQKADCDDIIIVQNGFITDTSYANLIFGDGEKWFTPTTYLLNGTCRQRLLLNGEIQEIPIRPEDLSKYKYCKLINAMIYPEDSVEIGVGGIK